MPGWLTVLEPEDCEDCGLCCEGVGSPVLLYQTNPGTGANSLRPDDLPAELIEEIDEHFQGLARGEEPQEYCLWFDPERRACRHYQWRPQICRDYEMGGTSCLERRRPFLEDTPS